MLRTRALVAASLVVAGLFSASPARADAESDAKDLFARGRDLRAKHDCAAAVGAFRKAYEVFPGGLGSLRNVAECEEELRHPATARRTWLDLRRALVTATDTKYRGWDAQAQAAADRLAPAVAKLTIQIAGARVAVRPGELTVSVNRDPLPVALLGTEIERDPGPFTIAARRTRDGATAIVSLNVQQGESRRVELLLERDEAEPARAEPGADVDPNAARRTIGYVTLGVGVASLLGAGVSLGVRQSALGDVDGACPTHAACPPSLASTVSRGRVASTLVNVLGGLGVVATGAGIALILASPSSREPVPARTAFVLRPMSLGALGAYGATAEWSLP